MRGKVSLGVRKVSTVDSGGLKASVSLLRRKGGRRGGGTFRRSLAGETLERKDP